MSQSTERYVVFIKKVESGDEFVSSFQAAHGEHGGVMKAAEEKYPYPRYVVHTAYTERELENILQSLKRWAGPTDTAAAPKKDPSPARAATATGTIH